MKIFYDPTTGQLRGYRKSEAEELQFAKPAGVSEIEIDETANPAVAEGLDADYNSHSVVAGQLARNAVPVLTNPESQDRAARREVKQQINDRIAECDSVMSEDDTIIASVDASTNAQLRGMVKTLARNQKTLARNQKRILRILKGLL
jgi:hypothetical protein